MGIGRTVVLPLGSPLPSFAMPPAEAHSSLDREVLRGISRTWSSHQRRLLVERILEYATEEDLERLLDGLVRLERVRCSRPETRSLDDRVADHVSSTRRGDFLGDFVIRNKHGQRGPWQTKAWVAATSHLFDLALAGARSGGSRGALDALVALVQEVDERIDELVVFGDSCAREKFWYDLESASSVLDQP